MTLLALFVPFLVVFLLFQFGKGHLAWLDNLEPIAKQLLVVILAIGASIAYAKSGLPIPAGIQGIQDAALVGLIQGLAAIGTHSVKVAANP